MTRWTAESIRRTAITRTWVRLGKYGRRRVPWLWWPTEARGSRPCQSWQSNRRGRSIRPRERCRCRGCADRRITGQTHPIGGSTCSAVGVGNGSKPSKPVGDVSSSVTAEIRARTDRQHGERQSICRTLSETEARSLGYAFALERFEVAATTRSCIRQRRARPSTPEAVFRPLFDFVDTHANEGGGVWPSRIVGAVYNRPDGVPHERRPIGWSEQCSSAIKHDAQSAN